MGKIALSLEGYAEACPELFFALKVKNIFTIVKIYRKFLLNYRLALNGIQTTPLLSKN